MFSTGAREALGKSPDSGCADCRHRRDPSGSCRGPRAGQSAQDGVTLGSGAQRTVPLDVVITSHYDEFIINGRTGDLMILVHLAATWPDVLADRDTPERATLEAWAQITDDALAAYGDAILGIYQNEVVTAFEIDGWGRNEDGRVVFSGHPSDRFGYLIGTPNP